MSPTIEEAVESSGGGQVPRSPGMLVNRYNRSDEAPGVLRNVVNLTSKKFTK